MGLDALAKRYSPWVICAMLAIAAYFQASGMSHIVGAILASTSVTVVPAGRSTVRSRPLTSDRDLSANAILSRNPFDSITGPIVPHENTPAGADHAPDVNRDPYSDPPCEMARAVLIASSNDPDWSFAAILGPDGKTVLRRRGEDFFGGKVTFVGDARMGEHAGRDDSGMWDRVWLTSPTGMRCQLQLGAKPPAKMAAPPPMAAPAGGGLPPELRGKIRQIGEHEFEVDRSAVEALIANPADLMKTRVVPENGGLKLAGIRPSSLLGTLGIQNGDRLTSINGFEMNDPQKMLEAYTKLLRADHLTASVVRNGKPVNIDFNIK